ncbi:MAG TPA: class I SAM-dependent methyltransferase [Pyrinomonadaceae bacterium]|nr:class I SAM-dependent methyltransferase [Pyrinomonadaceae bacterium]
MDRVIPERIAWAVGVLDVQPNDKILEIGCGRGFAIGPISEKLRTGHLTAIDLSEAMIDAARQTNAGHIAAGKASIIHADLLNADLPAAHFNKIFLFNLNVFWMDPKEELRVIRRLLNDQGKFFIFHQPPPGHDPKEFAAEFEKNLTANEFAIERVLFKELDPVGATVIISRK